MPQFIFIESLAAAYLHLAFVVSTEPIESDPALLSARCGSQTDRSSRAFSAAVFVDARSPATLWIRFANRLGS